MLVLCRKPKQIVWLGEEIKLTVEEIRTGEGGEQLPGMTVRLGFECPRCLAIARDELLCRGREADGGNALPKAPPPAGTLVHVPQGEMLLRIEAPHRLPVRCHGSATVQRQPPPAENTRHNVHHSGAIHRIRCREEDRITICNNIVIAVLGFRRFIFAESVVSQV